MILEVVAGVRADWGRREEMGALVLRVVARARRGQGCRSGGPSGNPGVNRARDAEATAEPEALEELAVSVAKGVEVAMSP